MAGISERASKWMLYGAALLAVTALAIAILAALVAAAAVGYGGGGGSADDGYTTEEGDVEFLFTYYDPGQGGVNGTNCGGAHGTVCLKAGSPTGYEITEQLTGKKYTGGGAIPQPGSVDYGKVPVPYLHGDGEKWKGKGIIIPCYNDDEPFVPIDHYATSITEPNALDLAMTGAAHDRFMQCLQENKIETRAGNNGLTGATYIKGKIVDLK